jgi:hypothetical protein
MFDRIPGTCVKNALSPDSFVGMSSTSSVVKSVLVAVDVTSTSGAAALTLMVSATSPTRNTLSRRATKPTVSRTPSWRMDWNPESSQVTV